MPDQLTPELRQFKSRIRDFVDRELIPWEVHAEMHGGEVPEEVRARHVALATALGLNSMDAPVALGGGGRSMLAQVLAQEQIGRVTNALGWCFSNVQRWLTEVATPHQVETWVKPMIAHALHECYAITEEGAGSDLNGIQATARRNGEEYVLDGEKWHVTSGNLAHVILFQALLADGPHAGQHCLFFVDRHAPGVEIVRSPAYSHTFRSHHPVFRFSSVRVPMANRIGAEGDGMTYTHSWFRYERLMIGARCCGAAERLIEEALDFARNRPMSGEMLLDKQAVQFMLADSVAELWGARLMVRDTARAIDDGLDAKIAHGRCSMVKLQASEMANRVADRAVQIFGGRGYMRENVAERLFRELRVERIWEGASEIQRHIIADRLAKRGLAALID
jgi:alkylation response protein AidB-like acyl-CoA dehydrogenase